MLYYLGSILNENFASLSFLRLVDFITFRAIAGAITALLLNILFGARIILYLHRRGQRDMPRRYVHFSTGGAQAKVYGGGLIILTIVVSALLWCKLDVPFVLICIGAIVWFSGIGAVDDYLKVRHEGSDFGLTETAKLSLQFLFALGFALVCIMDETSPLPSNIKTQLYIPFFKYPVVDLSWAYVPFIIFTVISITNAVNLADGIDGLAIVPVAFVVIVYGVFAYVSSHARIAEFLIFPKIPGVGEVAVICSIVFGACLGFLWFNCYPANVIMGDTGSLGLGGLLATVAVLVKQEFLFLILGGVFVGEAFSVLVQEKIGIKWLGRRFFERAPIHDHFRVRGLADTKIVIRFWIIAGILALCALATLKIR